MHWNNNSRIFKIIKHIIYAIPGKKDKDEQPYDGRTGFVTWASLNGKDRDGCWLMFYDFSLELHKLYVLDFLANHTYIQA